MVTVDYFEQLNQALKEYNVVELKRDANISKGVGNKGMPYLIYDLSILVAPRRDVYDINNESCKHLDSLLLEITSSLHPLEEIQIFDERGWLKDEYCIKQENINKIINESSGFIKHRDAKVFKGIEDSAFIYAPHMIDEKHYDEERTVFKPPELTMEKKIGKIAGIRRKKTSEEFMFSPDYNVQYELYRMGFSRNAEIQKWEDSEEDNETVSNDVNRRITVLLIPNAEYYRIVSKIRKAEKEITKTEKDLPYEERSLHNNADNGLRKALESRYGSVGMFINWEFFVKKFNRGFEKLHKD